MECTEPSLAGHGTFRYLAPKAGFGPLSYSTVLLAARGMIAVIEIVAPSKRNPFSGQKLKKMSDSSYRQRRYLCVEFRTPYVVMYFMS